MSVGALQAVGALRQCKKKAFEIATENANMSNIWLGKGSVEEKYKQWSEEIKRILVKIVGYKKICTSWKKTTT